MSTNLAKLHHDHTVWHGENAFWHDQLREWEAETARAIKDLQRVEKALLDHHRDLQTHAAAIRLYQMNPDKHEHDLADACRQAGPSAASSACEGHQFESQNHDKQRQLHEGLKRGHHELMARWSLLLKAIGCEQA